MSLCAYSNRFLMLRNHMWMVVPRVFYSCWRQIQDKSNLMHIAPWSEDDMRQLSNFGQWFLFLKKGNDSYQFFLRLCASARFSSQGSDNLMRRTLFFESNHATMSGRFSVWIMWTGNCRDVLRSAETFQSLAPFSSFILDFFCFLSGHSPSLWNWIMCCLAVTGCWFAVSY